MGRSKRRKKVNKAIIAFEYMYTYIMSKEKEKHCRLCLQMVDDNFILIEEVREIFEVPLLKVDLSVSEEPVVCKKCMESIQEAFDFKSTCVAVNNQIVSLAISKNSSELDIRDVYLNENENKGLAFNKDYSICRLCLQCLEKNNFNLLSDLKENVADEMLSKCIPELNLNIIKEPAVCGACMKSLESYYSFTIECQNTEGYINTYCKLQGAVCDGPVNLSNVLKFLFKTKLERIGNCNETAALKTEDNLFQNGGDLYSDINNMLKIEEEELFIKHENTYVDCEPEENKCGENKQKEADKYDVLTHKNVSEKHIIHEDNSEVTMYKCNLCTYETKWKQYLKYHMITHKDSSELVMYKCDVCIFETKYKRSLKLHMLIHQTNSKVTMYKCNLCTFETKWKQCLKTHMITHKDSSDIVMFKCALCRFETKHKGNFKTHMLTHKDSSDVVMYSCDECTFKTKHKMHLKRHMLIHKEVTMYKCNLCSYESKWKNYLKSHMLIHKNSSDVVMYRCHRCTFKTKYKHSINRHMMIIHKDKKEVTMYKCELCSYEANRKFLLKRHMLRHYITSDVVMYRCEQCAYETKHKHRIKRHRLFHEDNSKVYKCDLCSYEGKRKDHLRTHMLTHKDSSEVIMYKCERCAYETRYKSLIKKHRLIHKNSSE